MKKIAYMLLGVVFMASVLLSAADKKYEKSLPDKSIVSMDFKKISVRELLQFMAEAMCFNIIMSDGVTGNVSLHFHDLSWQLAFDTVLEMCGLVKKQKGNVLFVATAAELADRQRSLNEAAPVKTIQLTLHHADVTSVSNILKSQANLFTSFAIFSTNPINNSLWVKETVENLPLVIEYIRQLDKPEPQLLVTAKIINVDNQKMHELGVSLGQTEKTDPANRLHFSFAQHAATNMYVAIASIAQSQLLNLQLDALESEGHSKIIADPKVITQNRKTALIEAGEEIPYQESTSSGATSTTFKKAALSLKATPIILPDGRITLELEINQNKTSPLAVNGTPAIQTQVLKTEVVVREGQTVVLGGIFEKSEIGVVNKIPLLSDLPLVGSLISQKSKHLVQKELLILVSLHLLGNGSTMQ